MSIQKITYTDKQQLNANASINAINKVQATDMNEIKSVVNTNADLQGDLSTLVTTDKSSLVNAINEMLGEKLNSYNRNTNQAISSGSFVKVLFANTDTGDHAFTSYNSGDITITEAGTYLISTRVAFPQSTSGGRYVDVYFSNGKQCGFSSIQAFNGMQNCLNTCGVIKASANDSFSVRVYQTSGSSVNLASAYVDILKIK